MGGEDMDREFTRNVLRLGDRYKGTELGGKKAGGDLAGMDEEEEVDVRMFERREDRLTERARQQRQRHTAIREHKQWGEATASCSYCMDSSVFRKDFLISLGETTLLMYRHGHLSLLPGHACISPIKHAEASTGLDEDVALEVEKTKAALRKMWASKGKSVVFLETVLSSGSRRQHCTIEAIPLPRSVALDAPLYFKQGLMEVDEQWATHKKLISTKGRPLRACVPKNFPYFFVEWGDEGEGYAHIIEDKEQFPKDFGVSVIAGMLGVDPPRFDRKGQLRGDPGQERQAVAGFVREWQPFDWTRELDGGEYWG